jgi:hypothetical protein
MTNYSELTTGQKTNLVSWWNLDEESGNRSDSHGANTLTDNNSVLSDVIGEGYVWRWLDKSNNTHSLEQPTASAQPKWLSSGFGTKNKPQVFAEVALGELYKTSTSLVNLSPYFSISAVFKAGTTKVYFSDDRFTDNTGFNAGIWCYINASNVLSVYIKGVLALTYTTTPDENYVMTINSVQNGASNVDYYLYINGVEVDSNINVAKPVFTLRDLQLFKIGTNSSSGEYMSELISYSNSLTSEEITKVQNYLNNKYGVY